MYLVILHLVAGRAVGHGLQTRGGLTHKDVPFAGDGPNCLFGRWTLDVSRVTARHTQQGQLESRKEMQD